MSIEWMSSAVPLPALMTAAEATEQLRPNGPVKGTHVLFMGDQGSDGAAVEGTLAELERFARSVLGQVARAQDVAGLPPCTGPNGCGASAGTPCEPGCMSLVEEATL